MKEDLRYVGEYNSKKNQNIGEVIEYVLSFNYGTTLENTELGKILRYNINDEEEFLKYKSTMNRVRNILINYGYVLKGVPGIGYYILKPSQVSNHCYRNYIKRAGRTLDKSVYILEHTDKTELNNDRMEELNNLVQLNKEIVDNMWKNIRESAYYSRKDYYDSLED